MYNITCHTYFRYQDLLPLSSPSELSKISKEFIQHQLLDDANIPCSVWDNVMIAIIKWMLFGADGRQTFSRLSNVAKLVLVIPHSNSGEERVFSIIRKNKTPFRPNLGIDKTLPSLLTVKLATEEPCHKYESPERVIENAGKVTW